MRQDSSLALSVSSLIRSRVVLQWYRDLASGGLVVVSALRFQPSLCVKRLPAGDDELWK